MGNPFFAWVFAGLITAIPQAAALTSAQPAGWTEDGMDAINQQVTAYFSQFRKAQDPMLALKALETIEAAVRDKPIGDVAAFQQAVARWLNFFKLLDRFIDPNWDSRHAPPMGVPPPRHHGMVRGSGEVDPETIPDPKVRAQYVLDLQANNEAHHHFFTQLQLRRTDERAMRFLKPLLMYGFAGAEGGRQIFEAMLAASPVNAERKKRLRALASDDAPADSGGPEERK